MKTKKFLFVDADAAEDIVSTRTLQSEDFEHGTLLGLTLAGAWSERPLTPRTHLLEGEAGMYILNDKSSHADFIVIDLESAPIFDGCTAKDALIRFQRLLRFARRRWTKVSPGQNEKMLLNSTKAVVFPYPFNARTAIRISVELAPDAARRERRSKGFELLAYRIGTDDGGGPQEQAPVTNFRKAIDGVAAAAKKLDARRQEAKAIPQSRIDSLTVTRLHSGGMKGTIEGCSFDDWREYLTSTQRNFVEQELVSPHRIEGPAGTGKTLSLVLKCISQLRRAQSAGREHRALFVAHSEATRRTIDGMFAPERDARQTAGMADFALQSLRVTTLQELCGELLRYELSDEELLDRDAFESKQSQLLYAVESLQEVLANDLQSHAAHLSTAFNQFVTSTDVWVLAEIMQHEMSVMIKGRADEDLAKYKRLPRLAYGLPVANEGDKAFAFLIYGAYQKRLRASGQFDTDDVVLSALRQLDTPIWRRRREKEGFDSIFIDETHLFNINELSIFHRLTRKTNEFPIAYSADVSQSLGDRGWGDVEFTEALLGSDAPSASNKKLTTFGSIFRCSPEIVNLAFSVTSSGATLFTNFHDPMAAASSAFTDLEERKSAFPQYHLLSSDDSMIEKAFEVADSFVSEMACSKGDVAIIIFGSELFAEIEKSSRNLNKPVEILKQRGDFEGVKRALNSGRFVLSTPDFVGGLEFDGVVLVGVDKGRVPPRFTQESIDSENFVSYATHQRLYVAITRARFRIAILGVKARGPSPILENAIAQDIVAVI